MDPLMEFLVLCYREAKELEIELSAHRQVFERFKSRCPTNLSQELDSALASARDSVALQCAVHHKYESLLDDAARLEPWDKAFLEAAKMYRTSNSDQVN
jgi:hypothetical protein